MKAYSTITNIQVDDNTANQWKNQVPVKLEELKKEVSSNDGWKLHSEEAGVKRYIKDEAIAKYKAVGTIKTKMTARQFIQWLAALQKDMKLRGSLFPTIMEVKTIQLKQFTEEENKSYEVEWALLETPSSLVANRELQMLRMYDFGSDNEAYVIGFSIDHPNFPKTKGFVVSTIKITGWKVVKKDADTLEVVFITQNDPGGWLPSKLSTNAMLENLLIINKYANVIKQQESKK